MTRSATRSRRSVVTEVAPSPARRTSAERLAGRDRGSPGPLAVVYYVRRADGSIKIGCSAHLADRLRALRALRAKHGPLQLLATEPGDFNVEAARQITFHQDAIGGEWFRRSAELLSHVATVAGAR